MINNDQLAILIPIEDMVISATVSYLVFKYVAWKNNQLIKKNNPTRSNGHNLDYSFRIDNSEVIGFHLRGTTPTDLISKLIDLIMPNGTEKPNFTEKPKTKKDV